MFTCKQVSRTLENKNYEDLSPFQKAMVRIHIALCVVCGKYNTQVMDMQKLSRCFCNRDHVNDDLCLSSEKKDQMKQALSEVRDDA